MKYQKKIMNVEVLRDRLIFGVVRVIAGDRMYYHRDPQQKLWCYAVISSAANVQSEQRSRA